MQLISQKSFSDLLSTLHDFKSEQKLAVAVSGGGDSMALAFLLSKFAEKNDIKLHVLTVDHGLREESKKEAKAVGSWVKNWPQVKHKVLNWAGEKPKTRIQEEARKARYDLMSEYCRKNKIKYLFLAHHGDDQVETFLFRLAKGSGIDGLAVMPSMQEFADITLVRPLLDCSHEQLITVCKKNKIDWIEDPSNQADKYARVRLRQSREVLEREGLSADRILTLSKRFIRARNALEQVTEKAFEFCLIENTADRIEIDLAKYLEQPKEIGLRILQKAISLISGPRPYPPSLQILETIMDDIYDAEGFRAATLGGCIIRRRKRRNLLEIMAE